MYFFLVSKGLNTSYNYAYIFVCSFHNGGSPKMGIPVWVSISDGHWKISIHFQKIHEIVGCTSEKKSDFHMGHVEIIFKLLLFDKFFD